MTRSRMNASTSAISACVLSAMMFSSCRDGFHRYDARGLGIKLAQQALLLDLVLFDVAVLDVTVALYHFRQRRDLLDPLLIVGTEAWQQRSDELAVFVDQAALRASLGRPSEWIENATAEHLHSRDEL